MPLKFLKFVEPRKLLRLVLHEEIQLYVDLVVSAQLACAPALAEAVGISPKHDLAHLKSCVHALGQDALNEGRADSNTVVHVCIESLIDGSTHLRGMTTDSMQMRLRDALESAEYCFGLLTCDLDVPEEFVCAFFDGLARVVIARELSMHDRREFASEAQAAFVTTLCEAVCESLREASQR